MPRRIARYAGKMVLEGRVEVDAERPQSRGRMLARLAAENLEVRDPRAEHLCVDLQPFERRWMPQLDATGVSESLARALRERVEIRLTDAGDVEYRFHYWSFLQMAIHAAICALVLLMPSLGGGRELVFFALGHLVAFGAWWVTVRIPAEDSIRRALGVETA